MEILESKTIIIKINISEEIFLNLIIHIPAPTPAKNPNNQTSKENYCKHVNGKVLKTFPLRLKTNQNVPYHHIYLTSLLVALANTIRFLSYKDWKKKNPKLLCTSVIDTILHIGNPREWIDTLLEIVSGWKRYWMQGRYIKIQLYLKSPEKKAENEIF